MNHYPQLKANSHWFSLLALLISLGFGGYAVTRHPAPAPSPAPAASPSPLPSAISGDVPVVSGKASICATAPQYASHVYHPQRLTVLQDCIQVTGVVKVIRHEKDGDLHVLLRLDPGQEGLLNAANLSLQQGDLIVEPDCVGGPVTQADAVSACAGTPRPPGVELLQVGSHVRVTGPYVNDTQHGWNEVHSVLAVEAI